MNSLSAVLEQDASENKKWTTNHKSPISDGSRIMLDRIDYPHAEECPWVKARELLYPEVTHAIPYVPFNMYSCHAKKNLGEGVMRGCARPKKHEGPHLYHTRRGPVESMERDK